MSNGVNEKVGRMRDQIANPPLQFEEQGKICRVISFFLFRPRKREKGRGQIFGSAEREEEENLRFWANTADHHEACTSPSFGSPHYYACICICTLPRLSDLLSSGIIRWFGHFSLWLKTGFLIILNISVLPTPSGLLALLSWLITHWFRGKMSWVLSAWTWIRRGVRKGKVSRIRKAHSNCALAVQLMLNLKLCPQRPQHFRLFTARDIFGYRSGLTFYELFGCLHLCYIKGESTGSVSR